MATSHGDALTVSPDGRTLSLWMGSNDMFANYSVANNKWTRLPLTYNFQDRLVATTNPTTGTVYFPGGYDESVMSQPLMVKVDRRLKTSTEAIPSSVDMLQTPNAFVWSKYRNSFIMHSFAKNPARAFYEYIPSNRQWKMLVSFLKTKIQHINVPFFF
jgi:hypothetical protein